MEKVFIQCKSYQNQPFEIGVNDLRILKHWMCMAIKREDTINSSKQRILARTVPSKPNVKNLIYN